MIYKNVQELYLDVYGPIFRPEQFIPLADLVIADVRNPGPPGPSGRASRQITYELGAHRESLAQQMAIKTEEFVESAQWYRGLQDKTAPEKYRCFYEEIDDAEFAELQLSRYVKDEKFRRRADFVMATFNPPRPKRIPFNESYSCISQAQSDHDRLYRRTQKLSANISNPEGPPLMLLEPAVIHFATWLIGRGDDISFSPYFAARGSADEAADDYLSNNAAARFLIGCARAVAPNTSIGNVDSAWQRANRPRSGETNRAALKKSSAYPS